MAAAETDIRYEAPESATDFRGILLPIGFVRDISTDTPALEILRAEATQLAETFRNTIATLLQTQADSVTNHAVELSGVTSLQGHPEGYPTKNETVRLAAMQTYEPGTTQPDGMMYVMQRITSVNGSQAVEAAVVSVPEVGDPYIRLERTSTNKGNIDAIDTYFPNTYNTLSGVRYMFGDIAQAVEKGDAGLEITRVQPVRVVKLDQPYVSTLAEVASNSVEVRDSTLRQTAALITDVYEELPRGRQKFSGDDGSFYEVITLTSGRPASVGETQLRKHSPDGTLSWAGLSVPFAPSRRNPAEISFSVHHRQTAIASEFGLPYNKSGLLVDFRTNSPQAIQGGMSLAGEFSAGIRSGKIKAKK